MAKLLLISSLFAAIGAQAACTATGACVSAGARPPSVDPTRSALLGARLSLSAVGWDNGRGRPVTPRTRGTP
ncbi:hypothetical protein LQ564_22765 [Massilia sp. G4R7]|uniref:Uncharacterized protein n=1 Tax=Massilia phyllostachyos TaxID=2898585 RepID=A0ABS8QC03_9BURK|nr:hypothetical protein [Massilia phyllostachyos]MCD2519129.1 hypothetical protein [Massilia phyllostachyos]